MTFPLSYELADALKKAGWPQPHGEIADPSPGEWVKESPDGITRQRDLDEKAYSPSLEELIEACPRYKIDDDGNEGVLCLEPWKDDEWCAGYRWGSSVFSCKFADSHKAALAHLWLKLKAEGVLK